MAGTAGEVNYPVHIRMAHQDMLFATTAKPPVEDFEGPADYPAARDYNVMADMDAVRTATTAGVNPHTNAAAYDPANDLAVAQGRATTLHNVTDLVDPITDIAAYVSSAQGIVDNLLVLDDSKIDDAVAAFDASSKVRHRRRSGMVAAGLFDIRATMSSTFGQAMAMEELERQNAVDQYEASLRNSREDQRVNQRAGLIVDLADKQLRAQSMKLQTLMQGAQIQDQTSRNKIVASQDQISFDLSREIDDTIWDLTLYAHFNSGMAAVNGLAAGLPGPTQLERALGVAFAGVSAAAMLLAI